MMAQSSGGKSKEAKKQPPPARDARLADALRANLRRRKAQSAARKDLSESGADQNDDAVPITGEQTRNEKT
jgi:hypothetical protein